MSAELEQETPQESLEGVSEGLGALMGIPAPHTLDGALYEAYRAGWQDSRQTPAATWGVNNYLLQRSWRKWRRRFVTLPEADDE